MFCTSKTIVSCLGVYLHVSCLFTSCFGRLATLLAIGAECAKGCQGDFCGRECSGTAGGDSVIVLSEQTEEVCSLTVQHG